MDWKEVDKLKSDAKQAFNVKSYDDSFNCRKKAIELVNSGYNTAASIIYSNISQTELMNKDYSTALEHANKSLELDPFFKKSILRRATANCELKNYDNALIDLRYLYEHEPTNSQVISLMKRCSDLPKMKQELRVAYASYCLRKALQRAYQDHASSGFSPFTYSSLPLSLFRHLFLSLENFEFVSQLLVGTYVTPDHSEVELTLVNWFSVQTMKLKISLFQRIILSGRMFKIIFHLAPPKTFKLMISSTWPSEEMFGPWSRYFGVYHIKEGSNVISTIDSNDLQVIEQNAEIWTRLSYLPEMVKFKKNFSNLRELQFNSTKLPDMKFLKLWQIKQWPVKNLIFNAIQPRLKIFKRFDGVISNHVTTLFIPFGTDKDNHFTKGVYHNLCNDLTALKRVFPNLTEVTMGVTCNMNVKMFQVFIQSRFKQLILETCTAIDHKPEWCSNLRFLIDVKLNNPTIHDIKKTTLEALKDAVNSYRHDLNCVKNLRFAGPSVSEYKWFICTSSLFKLKFETDAAYFEIGFFSGS